MPTDEAAEIKPMYPYALTKWIGEFGMYALVSAVLDTNTSFRFFNIFGPRSRTSGTYGAVFGF